MTLDVREETERREESASGKRETAPYSIARVIRQIAQDTELFLWLSLHNVEVRGWTLSGCVMTTARPALRG